MKNHAKRCIKHLESQGFQYDEEASSPRKGRYAYRHPNAPDEVLKVFAGQDDTTSTGIIKRAHSIVESGWSGPRDASTIKERMRIRKQDAKSQRDREAEERNERAARADADYQERERLTAERRRQRELEGLMRPGNGR